MKRKKIAISAVLTLVLSVASIAGANDSGIVPTVKSDALVAVDTGIAKPGNLSTVRPTMKQGEILVKFKNTMSATSIGDLAYSLGSSIAKTIGKDKIRVVSLPQNISVEQAVRNFSSDPNVVYAQPNFIYYPTAVPNDTSYAQLWGLNNIGQTITSPSYSTNNGGINGRDIDAELAWNVITDCSAVIVAVIDTGINYSHEDLVDNMWTGNANGGWDFVDGGALGDNDPMATDGQIHGGHVAGTIGASGNNNAGTTGVCWQVKIMSVRVFSADPSNINSGTTATIIRAIEFAADNGAHVINMSLGGGGGFDGAFRNAITYARDRDVVVVVAAGNDNSNNDGGTAFWPCNFTQDNLICVAALDQAYSLASFSNTGTTSVDVGAPGTNVLSTWAGNIIEERTFIGWTFSTIGSAWASSDCNGFYIVPILYNPSAMGWCNGTGYANNTDSTIWGTYDLSGLLGAGLSYLANSSVVTGDFFSTYASNAGGNPNGTTPLQSSDVSTGGFTSFEHALDGCISATCSIGYRLTSNASGVSIGPGIAFIDIQTVEPNSSVYQNINGTSMASPHVAGIAALVRAYNPQYTYLDTVNAILGGGQATPALATTTTTGMAANAMGSLAFINTPTGVTATP